MTTQTVVPLYSWIYISIVPAWHLHRKDLKALVNMGKVWMNYN